MGLLSSIGDIFDPVSAAINKVAGPLGSVLGFMGQERTNDANTAQSAQQMAFQREMSDTSYQRAVKDMRAAGLNPMLAYSQGGASTPGGAKADIGNSVAAGAQSAQAAVQIQNTKADTALKEKSAELSSAQAAEVRSRTPVSDVPHELGKIALGRIWDEAATISLKKQAADWEVKKLQEEIRNAIATGKEIQMRTENTAVRTAIERINREILDATSPALKAKPYVDVGTGAVSSAAAATAAAKFGRAVAVKGEVKRRLKGVK